MYPVTHATIAVAAVKAGERLIPARWLPLDYRFAAFGALLPDLIDKPIGWILVPSLPDDHLWAHTAWLPLILLVAGLLVARRHSDGWLLLLGAGCLTHILVDPVNVHPRTLFWPLFGWTFTDVRGYLFVFPISLEIVLVCALLLRARRSDRARTRLVSFLRSGTA